jgi:hypothetical protein
MSTIHKTFFGKLLADIVSIFGGIFHAVMSGAETTFNNLPPATQAALLHGSGVMVFITTEVGKLPAEIRAAILAKFPDINEAALETGLYEIANGFKLNPIQGNLDDTIAKLQAYLTGLQGNVWNAIVQGAANILAVVLAPAGTKFGAITTLMEYVYQTFFAKKKS